MAAFQDRPPRNINTDLVDSIEAKHKEERVVWLLGAGFSKPLGGPLFSELLSPKVAPWVNSWLASKDVPEARHPEEAVGIFIDGKKAGLWDDAEECLSMIDDAVADPTTMKVIGSTLHMHLGRGEIERMRRVMRHFVGAATAHFVARVVEAGVLPESWGPFLLWADTLSDRDSIISFNYDRVVEHLLKLKGRKPAVLAKLHGTVPEALADDIRDDKDLSSIATPGPGKSKNMDETRTEAWDNAAVALKNAQRLVVIGYSFPASALCANMSETVAPWKLE